MINISGMNKAEVLAKLYNASQPLGMGILQFTPEDMTVAEAQAIIDAGTTDVFHARNCLYFDYLKGRVMKVDLSGDQFDPALYDRDNGRGAAALAIKGQTNGSMAKRC